MSQPGWSGQPATQSARGWQQNARGWQQGASDQSSWGQGPSRQGYWQQGHWQQPATGQQRPSLPPQHRPPSAPRPSSHRRSRLQYVLMALLGLTVVAFGVLVVTSLTGGDAYQNESYTVPPPDLNPSPLPQPKNANEAEQWVTANALYSQQVPQPVRCDNTKIARADQASKAELQQHLDTLTGCLMRVWNTPVTKAGFTLVRPSVTIYSGKVETGCGTLDYVNAVYCGADQQVYYSADLFKLLPEVDKKDSLVVDFVIAHEFGHALQGRSGILVSRIILQHNTDNKSKQLELNRRLEMQADCFSGMYIRATAKSMGLSEADVTTIKQSLFAVGDPKGKQGDHGQAQNRQFWGLTGFSTDEIGHCNTYTAPPDEVR